MTHKIKIFSLIVALMGVVSCSDNSTAPDNPVPVEGEGTINVTGALEAQHEGASWFIGLKSGGGNSYLNLTFNISDVGFASEEENTYSLTITMLGNGGAFELTTGEYTLGESEEVLTAVNYVNKEGAERASYGTSPDVTGTVTIQSISDTSIEASYNVRLQEVISTGFLDDFVNITGDLTAKCIANC
jgi:hypothetical protein